MSRCVLKYDTKASPWGPKRALPFKGPTPVNQEGDMFTTAWQDEALARDGVSREVPCSALKGETALQGLRDLT